VENAIEIAYRAVEEQPGKRIFLLSEMIHNPHVNEDLLSRGVRFLRTTEGEQLIPFDELTADDVVIIPAFGTTVEIQQRLSDLGVDTKQYNTTCPFVEKVWRRSDQIGRQDYSIVIHGKRYHEETRATFSHARRHAPVVVVRDIAEAETLADFITGKRPADTFHVVFAERCSEGFDADRDLQRIGVVNQTTMLATETQEITALLRKAIAARFGEANIADHFADTSDTLCYATNENQNATYALIDDDADLAVVVGGYNSSNTSHLVELCSERMPTFFIRDAGEILSRTEIRHFDVRSKREITTSDWLPDKRPVNVVLTAGASCPDALLDDVIERINAWFETRELEQVLRPFDLIPA
jgi:4-hydroxy-3-methylbut-2-enyl diphosphate reductase